MQIVVQTKNTGADFDPIILLTSDAFFVPIAMLNGPASGRVQWHCWGLSQNTAHLPSGCRNTPRLFGQTTA